MTASGSMMKVVEDELVRADWTSGGGMACMVAALVLSTEPVPPRSFDPGGRRR